MISYKKKKLKMIEYALSHHKFIKNRIIKSHFFFNY